LRSSAPRTSGRSSGSSRSSGARIRPWQRRQHCSWPQNRSRPSGERTGTIDVARRLQKALQILDEGMADGARGRELALLLGVGMTTLQRWRRHFASDGNGGDCRRGSHRHVAHRLSEEERQRILLTCNEPEFAALPAGQIVPALADRGLSIGSERSLYRVLHAHGQAHRGGRGPEHRRSRAQYRGSERQVPTRC